MITRRKFLSNTFLASVAMLLPGTVLGRDKKKSVKSGLSDRKLILRKNDCILFYGDSITDGNRNREIRTYSKPSGMGGGYALSISSWLACRYPDMGFKFFNRGINGNKTFQMTGRLEDDCINLRPRPTVVSVLTGINDYSLSYVKTGKGNPEKYEEELRELLTKIKDSLPGVRIILMEPYALPGLRDKTDNFIPGVYEYQPVAAKVAKELADAYVPLQCHFDEAAKKYGKQYFSKDGVHPWARWNEMIKRAWLEAVEVEMI